MVPGTKTGTSDTSTNSQEPTKPSVPENMTLSAVYTSDGMSPNEFKLISGKTYTLTIDIKDTISGCMHQILIP